MTFPSDDDSFAALFDTFLSGFEFKMMWNNSFGVGKINAVIRIGMRKMSAGIVESKVRVGDFNINYVKSGSGEKVVLLLPGALGSCWTDFKPQIEGLPNLLPNHTIIAWDPPGYGKSTPPNKKWSVDFYQDDAKYCKDLMENLKFSQYSLLGWSDGGIVSMIMASMFPESVEKLVIWGSNAYVLEDEIKIYESIRDVQKWSDKMRKPLEDLYGKEEFPKLWNEWIETLIQIYKTKDGNICKEMLKNIKCPTFIVHGAKDPMIVPEHVPYLQHHITNTELHVFPEGKHNIHLRYAKEFNSIVAKFLLK